MSRILQMQERFDAEFVRHQRQLYRFVAVLLPDRDAADEAFQQTCLVLLKSRDKFDPSRDFLAWAYGVARNVVREHLRSNRRVPLALSDVLLNQLAETQEQLSHETDTRLTALSRCLERIGTNQRELLERCYSGRESIRVIAEGLKLQPSVLYKRLDRIRWLLLRCIERAVAAEERS
jgi:RNA polymerase sigma-70 factor (ECF subfamily)